MPIPFATGSAVQIVVAAACMATMVAVFTEFHDQAVTRAAEDSIRTQLRAAVEGVKAPYKQVIPLAKSTATSLSNLDHLCDSEFILNDIIPLSNALIPRLDALEGQLKYLYSVYRLTRLRNGTLVDAAYETGNPMDYDWGECGCTPPYDEDTNPDAYCYFAAPVATTEGQTLQLTPAEVNTKVNAEDWGMEPFDVNDYEYGKAAMQLNESHRAGWWGPMDLYEDNTFGQTFFSQVYYLPTQFNEFGQATYVLMADLSLRWMKDLLVDLAFPATHTTIINGRYDTISATTYNITAFNDSKPHADEEGADPVAWPSEGTLEDELTNAVVEVKARLPSPGDWASLNASMVIDDGELLIGATQVTADGDLRLIILMTVQRGYYFNEGKKVQNIAVGIGVSGFVLCVLTSLALWRWIHAPLRQMGRDMRDASRLDCDVNRLKATARSGVSEIAALQAAFLRMNTCLVEARPYLPDTLCERMALAAEHNETAVGNESFNSTLYSAPVLAPGAGEDMPQVAIAFTDIVGSTALWEECPDMGRALKLHNQIIRAALAHHGGYEVKTIGDAFMAVFPALASACRFGVEAHDQLLQAQWPTALLEHPRCVRDGKGLWGGIVIRIGVEYGAVNAERNDLTGRYDYFGTPVNTAARLEASAPHGMVCVTAESLQALREDTGVGALKASEYSVHDMGQVVLRGLKDERAVCALSVPKLANRRLGSPAQQELAKDGRTRRGSYSTSILEGRGSTARGLKVAGSFSVAFVSVMHEQTLMAGSVDPLTRVVNVSLGRVQQALERTSGSLVTVLGTSILATWNAAQPCVAHRAESLRFLSLAKGQGRMIGVEQISVGLSMGRGVHGPVGHAGQRFMMVAGPCVSLAQLLCQSAKEEGDFALCAGLDGVPYPAVEGARKCLVPRAIWNAMLASPTESVTGTLSRKSTMETGMHRSPRKSPSTRSPLANDFTLHVDGEHAQLAGAVDAADVERGLSIGTRSPRSTNVNPPGPTVQAITVYSVAIEKYEAVDDLAARICDGDILAPAPTVGGVNSPPASVPARYVTLRY